MAFLGTNDYLSCTYFSDDKAVENVRFVQEATLKLFCTEWTKDDRVLIFTTDDAVRKNWQDNGHKSRKTGELLPRKGLNNCLNDLNLSVPFRNIPIPEGKSEEEIWDIFRIILDQLNHGDEVVFDITHAFRSIPMLAIVILNYAKIMKKIALHGIYYGAFEVLGSIPEAEKIPLKERRVPVLNLTPFDQLMEWSFAINRFIEAGDAAHISRLANNSARAVLSKTKGENRAGHLLRRIAKGLDKFTKTLSTCRGLDISDIASSLNKDIKRLEESDYDTPEPFKPIFKQIKDQMGRFKGDPILDGISAARWCLNHSLIQQGYTILQETLVSYFVLMIGQDQEHQKYREIAGQAVTIYLKKIVRPKWKKTAANNEKATRELLEVCKGQNELIKVFRNISKDRNDLNHAGHKKDPMQADKFGKQLSDMIDRIETCLADG